MSWVIDTIKTFFGNVCHTLIEGPWRKRFALPVELSVFFFLGVVYCLIKLCDLITGEDNS